MRNRNKPLKADSVKHKGGAKARFFVSAAATLTLGAAIILGNAAFAGKILNASISAGTIDALAATTDRAAADTSAVSSVIKSAPADLNASETRSVLPEPGIQSTGSSTKDVLSVGAPYVVKIAPIDGYPDYSSRYLRGMRHKIVPEDSAGPITLNAAPVWADATKDFEYGDSPWSMHHLRLYINESGINATVTYYNSWESTGYAPVKVDENGEEIPKTDTYEGREALELFEDFSLSIAGTGYEGKKKAAVIDGVLQESYVVMPFTFGLPQEDDIALETAMTIAVNSVTEKYALKLSTLVRFELDAVYYAKFEDAPGAVWWINLYPGLERLVEDFQEIGCYTAVIDAKTGEVLQLLSAEDGKG